MSERLDAFLAHAGVGSRSEVKVLIRKGRVTLDGVVVRDAMTRVPEGAAVDVDGHRVAATPAIVHAILHKPLGVACSHDPREAPLVYDLLDPAWVRAGAETAGRLDRETSGLLVLSTDGAFLHRLASPKKKVPKRYRVRYELELQRGAEEAFARGLRLDGDDEPTRPARLTIGARGEDGVGSATVILAEGRYHQVRRMIAAVGGRVIALHRDRIGALELPAELSAGSARLLVAAEAEALFLDPDDGAGP